MKFPTCTMRQLVTALLLVASASCVFGRLAVMSVDLGGGFMKIAIVKPGVPMEVALNKDSGRKTLTMVAFRNGERHFSNQAQSTLTKFPPKAVCYLNYIMGRQFDDPQVQMYREKFPYFNLVRDEERGTVLFKVDGDNTFSPEELLGMILEKAKEYAQDFAEQDIKDAVITVPAFYNQAERRAVLQAARLVGINVLQLMGDNAAVALNYGVFRRKNFNATTQYYMFYDMGATSTTATIVGYNVVKTKENGYVESNPQLTVKGVGFDRSLGGLEFTFRLRHHLGQLFDGQKKTSQKVADNNRAMAKLWKEAERVKKVLSANTEHMAQIEGLLDEKDFRAPVNRAEFEAMNSDLFERVTKPVEDALKVSEITLPEISEVILMGGGTRMPKIQELLMKFLGRSELGKSINTDEAAAMGAVYHAAYLGKGFKVKKFGVKEANIYPINVEFEKQKTEEDTGTEPAKLIKRTLFGRMNPFPQKKVMTFNKHTRDFGFKVFYSHLDFLSEENRKALGASSISEYKLEGVGEALTNNKDIESKGIKAHFRMDESGIVSLDKVESVFEKNASKVEEGERSAWSKLGSAIGGLFGRTQPDEDTKIEESTEADNNKQEPSPDTDQKTQKTEKKSEKKETDSGEAKKPSDKKAKEDASTSTDESEEKTEEEPKAEEEKKEDEKSEGKKKKEEKEDKDKDGKEKTSSKPDTATDKDGKNDTKKAEAPKVTTVKVEIKSQHQVMDVPDMSEEIVKKSSKRLSDLAKADQEKAEKQKIQNELEAFIFESQERLTDEDNLYFKSASDDEKTKLTAQMTETSDWLYEQGDDTKKEDYSAKLKALVTGMKPIEKRVKEAEGRPKALEALRSALNQTTVFQDTILNMTDPEDPIFTPIELETLAKVINTSRDWKDKQVAAQEKLLPHEDPILLVDEIGTKIMDLDREMRYLINKAKNFKPKPKPKPKDEKAANDTKAANATKTNEGDGTKTEKETTDTPTKTSQEEAPPADSEKTADTASEEKTSDNKASSDDSKTATTEEDVESKDAKSTSDDKEEAKENKDDSKHTEL